MSITYQQLAEEALKRWRIEPARMSRALEILEHPHMIYPSKTTAGAHSVRDSQGGWYEVNLSRRSCSCTDSAQGHICKHRLAVYLYTEQIERTFRLIQEPDPTPTREPQILHELGY